MFALQSLAYALGTRPLGCVVIHYSCRSLDLRNRNRSLRPFARVNETLLLVMAIVPVLLVIDRTEPNRLLFGVRKEPTFPVARAGF
jgi:hypothetical protein